MSWSKVGEVIGNAAPILGGLFGGPAGAAVGKLVASAIGTEPEPDEIVRAIASDPDAHIKLAKIERDYEVELRKLALEEARMEVEHQKAIYQDRQNARLRMRRSWMPPVLTIMITCAFFFICYILLTGSHVEAGVSDILYLLLGALVVVFKDACAFYLGGVGGNVLEEEKVNGKGKG